MAVLISYHRVARLTFPALLGALFSCGYASSMSLPRCVLMRFICSYVWLNALTELCAFTFPPLVSCYLGLLYGVWMTPLCALGSFVFFSSSPLQLFWVFLFAVAGRRCCFRLLRGSTSRCFWAFAHSFLLLFSCWFRPVWISFPLVFPVLYVAMMLPVVAVILSFLGASLFACGSPCLVPSPLFSSLVLRLMAFCLHLLLLVLLFDGCLMTLLCFRFLLRLYAFPAMSLSLWTFLSAFGSVICPFLLHAVCLFFAHVSHPLHLSLFYLFVFTLASFFFCAALFSRHVPS